MRSRAQPSAAAGPGADRASALVGATVAAVVAALLLWPGSEQAEWRERSRDALLRLAAAWQVPAPGRRVAVVDVDPAALTAQGAWPWPRERLAALIDAIFAAGAVSVGLDILLDGPDPQSPATLAARLAARLGRDDLAAWARSLPDGDATLATALASRPVALGFALDPRDGIALPPSPVLVRGVPRLDGVWQAPGAVAPPKVLRGAAAGLGALPLPGDPDGVVRRVPMLVGIGGRIQPGLALEAVRLAEGAAAFRLDGTTGTLAIGDLAMTLPPDGLLRLVPGWRGLSIGAQTVLAGAAGEALRGAVVFVGSSAPELGGLRATADGALVPSVQVQAAAAHQLLRGMVPLPPARWIEAGATALAAVAGIAATLWLGPSVGMLLLFAVSACGGIAVAGLAGRGWLWDPAPPALTLAAGFAATTIAAAARTRLREARIRHRFAQHLAPAVVALIAADPTRLKLRGERRLITALFTDIEDFTTLTRHAGPEALVEVLDGYIEGVAAIVVRHGGMVDKLVGDAVHAFFNMPLDLPGHSEAAVRCALEICAWTEHYRASGAAGQLGMQRTRIGIETGEAVVGDVGLSAKLDYTAHGDPVNATARLEAANKDLGTSICVGPGAAAMCPPGLLRQSGHVTLRGFTDPIATYEPWPTAADADRQALWVAAWQSATMDPKDGAAAFALIARRYPDDRLPARLAVALRGASPPTG